MPAPRLLPFGRLLKVLLVVSIGLLVVRLSADALAAQEAPQADPARIKAAREGMRDAARETIKALQERTDAGEAMTPAFIDLLSDASRRLCLAEEAVAADNVSRTKPLNDHLDRAKKLHAMLDQRYRAGIDVSRVQLSQAKYSVSEAELWIAQGKANDD
jgi:hypothetical protein